MYVINGTPIEAARTIASGMMSGITSPARPWFRLTTPDPDLAEIPAVTEWLHEVEQRMLDACQRTNIYNALHTVYSDLSIFATAVMLVEEDNEDPFRAYTIPIGEYCLAQSDRGVIDTLYHETTMTVRQVVRKFGIESCSRGVQDAYKRRQYDQPVEVLHVIEPRDDYDASKAALDPKHRPWSSCWMEKGTDGAAGFLRESGYHECPVLAPRWSVTGCDTYGSGPGMDALGDCKALQLYEKHAARAAEMLVDPPMAGPGILRARGVSVLPGEVTYIDGAAGQMKLEPVITLPPSAVQVMDGKIAAHERRIRAAFYADLWLMMAQDEQAQPITAREVQERHEEKMLQLGPVMERLEDELYNPFIERIFGILLRKGLLPKPPSEIQGQALQVEYQSIMSQAQKMISASGIQQVMAFAQNVAAVKPEVMDKVDTDKAVALMGDALAVNPTLIVPDARVQQVRAARAKQQQQAMASQQAIGASQAAKNLADSNVSGDNALTRLVGGVPAAQAQGSP